ncbi:serine hydrolase domain-containing protein [Ensifer adhaerens]|jgi:CubicO group peptidase (beta-lactamase class C family)|uniref:serine hydrolase domain-containing protein n=1 Tax=Ensifer adhaerens TaxID=106592 RepID=UPI00202F634C|nr:serine hydrolase [Ensifer adhaerens]
MDPHFWSAYEGVAEAGFQAERLSAVRERAASLATDALMVIRRGKVVLETGDLGRKYLCHSIRKSLLAALYGFEVESGRIELSATLESLGIDDRQRLSQTERQATVHDLLAARSGVYHPAGYETPAMLLTKEKRHSHGPGTFWCYNNWDFNALGTIYSRATGETVHEAFVRRIAEPLGMEDFSLAAQSPDGWYESFDASDHPAYPFRMSSRDLARFAQLYLQGGVWRGCQILPRGWVELCTLPYSHAGSRGAYGYMWWRERDGVFLPGVVMPRGSFAAWGVGGHYALVMPALDMVVIHRVDTETPGREVSEFQFGRLMREMLAGVAA